ncbi:adenosylcobinamide-phosphate synthase [Aquamicrobium terrae]
MSPLLAFLSLLAEVGLGYPDRLFRAIGHPVTWLGRLIAFADRRLNRATDTDERRRMAGIAALAVVVLVPAALGGIVEHLLLKLPLGMLAVALLASSLLAQKSLGGHVEAVAEALDEGGLQAGRKAVSMIVGRDPEKLDEVGVCRAAIESLAENFSDGIVAPALWLGIGGLAGGAAYKAVNTADSMIGHRTPRHEAFGWAPARFDDLVNLPASRLTALLIIAAAFIMPGANAGNAWHALRRDARNHRSPNAGWPEAAMAGALGLALAGPRVYGGVMVDDAFMGKGGRRDATSADIRRALQLYWMADMLLIGAFGLLAAVTWLI